jgi:hypothetical protein
MSGCQIRRDEGGRRDGHGEENKKQQASLASRRDLRINIRANAQLSAVIQIRMILQEIQVAALRF